MVRALLAGTKTQTRRIVKPRGRCSLFDLNDDGSPMWTDSYILDPGNAEWRMRDNPYGVPGDLLWVKETLRRSPDLWTYPADGAEVGWPARRDLAGKVRNVVTAIHCSRAASRITLRITDVRVQRLREIDDSDAFAEGVGLAEGGGFEVPGTICFSGTPRAAYAALWRQINGPDSWDANPWVWAVSFERALSSEEQPSVCEQREQSAPATATPLLNTSEVDEKR